MLGLVVWSLLIFQAKHFLCDFVLAPRYGLRGSTRYVDGARLALALLHGAGSAPAVMLLSGSEITVAAVFVVEILLTYHLALARDSALADPRIAVAIRPEPLIGAEQFLHQIFYVGVVGLSGLVALLLSQ